MNNQEYEKLVNLSNECHNKTISEDGYVLLNQEGEKLMNNDEIHTEVNLSDVEHEIISAIELTSCDLDNKSGEQSEIWSGIYKALERIRKKSTSWKWNKNGVKEIVDDGINNWCSPFSTPKENVFKVFKVSKNGSEFPEETQKAKELVPDIQRHVRDDYDLFVINLEDKSFCQACEFFYMNDVTKFWVIEDTYKHNA